MLACVGVSVFGWVGVRMQIRVGVYMMLGDVCTNIDNMCSLNATLMVPCE